jgi:RNA polymerase sigma-70 factor (ECF subfamily)
MERSTSTASFTPVHSYNASSVSETGIPAVSSPGDDAVLLQRVAAQDHQAFDLLYARYMPRLRAYLGHLLADPTLAEEVCHDVMLVMWQQAERFPTTVPLLAWLCGIARHKAHKAWARSAACTRVPAVPETRTPGVPEELLLCQESGRILAQALDALPYHERTTMVLLMQHGCSYQEIATRLDTPLSTVRTHAARACIRLRALVAALDATPQRRVSPSHQHSARCAAST